MGGQVAVLGQHPVRQGEHELEIRRPRLDFPDLHRQLQPGIGLIHLVIMPSARARGLRAWQGGPFRIAPAAWIMQESDRPRLCRDSRILILRCCLVHSQPGHTELIEVPDFRGMQALNAWLSGHDRGLLLTGPDPDSSQPLLHGVVVGQAPVPGGRLHRWDVVTVWIQPGPGDGDGVREPRRPVTPLQADAVALDPPFSS
jgi:hypothetical protein